jgi:hypothetical protein
MRIKIINKEEKVRINLVLPNYFIKSKITSSSIKKYAGNDLFSKNLMKKMYKVIKEYIKENGHFTLLEVESKDGTYVKIRL